LAHKAESLGYHPQVILSGRRVNDNMGLFVANKVVKLMINKGHKIKGANVLILGVTFKENCPDVRNTKVIDIFNELKEFGLGVDIYDPNVDSKEFYSEYGIKLSHDLRKYNAIILAVAHSNFLSMDFENLKINDNAVIFDVKSILDRSIVHGRL
jgi:UDP-N-acetyl-D-galactosamine dehydrogenase